MVSSEGAVAVRTTGLTTTEAARRRAEFGPNELTRVEGPSVSRLLLRQLASPLVGLLLVACVVAGVLGEIADTVAIAGIVLLNAAVGFAQEFRAERALLALRSLTAPRARVLRDGRSAVVAAREVVPGDVLLLESGDVVAADGRLFEVRSLATIEAALTGESLPVRKSTTPCRPGTPLAERADHVFCGTHVAAGTGAAEVVATGMRTEVGGIAELLAGADSGKTPLQGQLERVSRTLLVLCLVVVVLVAGLGLLRGAPWLDVLLGSVSLAVAAVPEGLPAVVTIALALGVQRMAARHVLVRRLHAVETLGATTVICTDKTGTLTTGIMRVREVWGPDHDALVRAAAACCDAELGPEGGVGDPTEIAILVEAAARGFDREAIEREAPRVDVEPFDALTGRMAILRADGRLYVKGAVERLLPLCRSGTNGVESALAEMARRGLRVLGVAVGTGRDVVELDFLGLIGMADPPRTEAIDAIEAARRGGIRTVMITGDHPVTAAAIARELGVLRAGEDAEGLVHARATPEDKIRIVRAWKARGAIVAMTGDGVNDAPAIREAHVGIAMGRTGTEVTREAAAVVITDDDFASILHGVREGRAIYDNIRKATVYLLTGNTTELGLMLGAALVGLPLPLPPLNLLWVNLVTDGLPALALVMDPPDRDTLERPPRSPSEPLLGARQWRAILAVACVEIAVVFAVYVAYLDRGVDLARSVALTTLVFAEVLRSFAARSPDRVIFEVGAFSNLKLLAVVVVTGALQLALPFVPAVAALTALVPLDPVQAAIAVGCGLIPATCLELAKLLRRVRRGPPGG